MRQGALTRFFANRFERSEPFDFDGIGLSSGPLKNLRVAFTGINSLNSGTVQLYECDLNAAQTVASNCAATQTGTYDIATVSGARVMRFAGFTPTVMDHVRHYTWR